MTDVSCLDLRPEGEHCWSCHDEAENGYGELIEDELEDGRRYFSCCAGTEILDSLGLKKKATP